MDELLTAIMTKFNGSAFASDVEGRIFIDQAPANTDFPYCVMSIVSDVPEKTWTEDMEDVILQFSLFSISTSLTEITTMYKDLKALFSQTVGGRTIEECKLTLTSSEMLWMRRANLVTMTEDVPTTEGTSLCRHWAVDYEVKLIEN